MSTSKKIRNNEFISEAMMCLILVGIGLIAIGGLYVVSIDIVKSPTVPVLALEDSWTRFLGTYCYEIAYTGISMLGIAALIKWAADTRIEKLERTNRFA